MRTVLILVGAAVFLLGATVVRDYWQHRRTVARWRASRCLCARFDLTSITAKHFGGVVHERQRCFPVREFIHPTKEAT